MVTQNAITTVLAEANAIKAEIAALQEELSKRTQMLAAAVGNATGKHTTEVGSFTISENNTYDEKVMQDNLLPGQIRRVSVTKVDKQAVKRLYPAVYAKAKKPNGVKVTLG